jgi:hypothetical protein
MYEYEMTIKLHTDIGHIGWCNDLWGLAVSG